MRHWLFHPLLFYPLTALLAALVIAVSIQPQAWPRPSAAVSGDLEEGVLILERESLGVPAPDPKQNLTVIRDFWGRASALRIAQLPAQPAPDATDQGVRVLLSSASAAALEGRAATIVLDYNPIPINTASGLAVSVRGNGPAAWVSQAAPPQSGSLRFEAPPQSGVNAIGLRALSDGTDQAYGIEITRIRIMPHPLAGSSD